MYPWRPVDHARSVFHLGFLVPDHLEGGRPCQRLHHNHLVPEGRRTSGLTFKLACGGHGAELGGRLVCGFAGPGLPRGRRAAAHPNPPAPPQPPRGPGPFKLPEAVAPGGRIVCQPVSHGGPGRLGVDWRRMQATPRIPPWQANRAAATSPAAKPRARAAAWS